MRILFFAHLKNVTHCSEMNLDCSETDADGLWRELIQSYPALERFRGSVRLARNSEYAGANTIFAGSDEVALIPPVSGG